MSASQRFLKYITFDTQSDENSQSVPSTSKQLALAEVLAQELRELGVDNAEVDSNGIVYGRIPANTDAKRDAIGLIAHMDTAGEMSGKDVKARIIPSYDGGVIELNEEYSMDPERFPELQAVIGDDLIVTDGTTLLGNDDKAGIAIIMEAVSRILSENPEHGDIAIAFTPDEEIGLGVAHFDIDRFNVDYAYTVDGESADSIDYETFNAAMAMVHFKGRAIHPGSAKNQMINAAGAAVDYASLMPSWMKAEHTEGREGFIHLLSMSGECEHAVLQYLIHDHDKKAFEEKKELMRRAADYINARIPGVCTLEIRDQYENMKDYMHGDFRSVRRAEKALRKAGIEPVSHAVRGGTDGAMLTQKGLNTPNLGTGGGNCHGRYEFASINKMEKLADVVCSILTDEE